MNLRGMRQSSLEKREKLDSISSIKSSILKMLLERRVAGSCGCRCVVTRRVVVASEEAALPGNSSRNRIRVKRVVQRRRAGCVVHVSENVAAFGTVRQRGVDVAGSGRCYRARRSTAVTQIRQRHRKADSWKRR